MEGQRLLGSLAAAWGAVSFATPRSARGAHVVMLVDSGALLAVPGSGAFLAVHSTEQGAARAEDVCALQTAANGSLEHHECFMCDGG